MLKNAASEKKCFEVLLLARRHINPLKSTECMPEGFQNFGKSPTIAKLMLRQMFPKPKQSPHNIHNHRDEDGKWAANGASSRSSTAGAASFAAANAAVTAAAMPLQGHRHGLGHSAFSRQ